MHIPEPLQSPIAKPAYPISLTLAALALGCFLLSWLAAAWVLVALSIGNLAFFRNPTRTPPPGETLLVAPGDGRVVEVIKTDGDDEFVGPAWKVAIFLSVFNVHINRSPITATVKAIRQKGSQYLAAFNGDASELNVQTRMDLETDSGLRISVVQITGLIARRILCYAETGQRLERGESYGLIRYGSRMEIYLPVQADIRVAKGDRVRGGSTVIAEVKA